MPWLTLVLWSGPVLAVSIGLFSTPDCSSCNLTVPPGETRSFYASVVTAGLPNAGVVNAMFRITGLPSGWLTTVTPHPNANYVTGDLFGSGGSIEFGDEGLSGDCVTLYTIAVTNYNPQSNVVLRVERRLDPAGPPAWQCRLVHLNCPCGPYCVDGGVLFINSDEECTVGTARSTWTAMKELYQ